MGGDPDGEDNNYDTYFNEEQLPPTSIGTDDYGDDSFPQSGPSAPPNRPPGPPIGPPLGVPPPPPPINLRNLPHDHPLKWNDDSFYFDHDFKPTSNGLSREFNVNVNSGGKGTFFDDFSGFYRSSNHARNLPSKSFGATDGFPNFFEEGQNVKFKLLNHETFELKQS